jgi:hypothetical protein
MERERTIPDRVSRYPVTALNDCPLTLSLLRLAPSLVVILIAAGSPADAQSPGDAPSQSPAAPPREPI